MTWQVAPLSKIGTFLKGFGIPKPSVQAKGLNAVRYGELYTKHNVLVKNVNSYISEETSLTATPIIKGDILFAGSGETIDEIGKSAMYAIDKPGYAGGDIVILRPNESNNQFFLAYTLNSDMVRKELRKLGQGQSVVHIYKKDLEKLELVLPLKAEQERIVAILESWDKYLELIDKKIALKKQLKKGLMQQLLTGKKRLPGFCGEWSKTHIGKLAKIDSGYGFPERLQGKNGLEFPFIKVSDMNLNGNENRIITWNNTIDDDDRTLIGARAFKAGSIVFPKIGAAINTNKKRVLTKPTIVDNNVMVLCPNNANDSEYFYQWLISFDISRWANDSGVPSMRKSEVEGHLMYAPDNILEREKIGNVLNCADVEIENLRSMKKNITNQKKYLLKNLISGIIRTPENLTPIGERS